MLSLTRELAAQWARLGVRVNAIAPGWFPSEMTEAMFADESGQQFIRKRTPLGRAGRLEELIGPLLLLASDASSYITGQTLVVDGGWSMV
jgi:NAD(P)-dependent dehydrogenase (short-subunit alcohol dehydrogenase family)